MKLSPTQINDLVTALQTAKQANIKQVALYANMIRGVSETENSIIFSKLDLGLPPDTKIGIPDVQALEKRLQVFGDTISCIEGEVGADGQTIKRLVAKSTNGKIEFRCSSVNHIKHPKNTPEDLDNITLARDVLVGTLIFKHEELQQLIRAAKLPGTEVTSVQIRRDGTVHIECFDSDNNLFAVTLDNPLHFEEEEFSTVNTYAVGTTGVLLNLMEAVARERKDTTSSLEFPLYSNGMIGCRVNGHFILAAKRAEHTEDEDE